MWLLSRDRRSLDILSVKKEAKLSASKIPGVEEGKGDGDLSWHSPTCPHNIVNFGLLAAEIGSGVLSTPSKFQRGSRLGSVTARRSIVSGISQALLG